VYHRTPVIDWIVVGGVALFITSTENDIASMRGISGAEKGASPPYTLRYK